MSLASSNTIVDHVNEAEKDKIVENFVLFGCPVRPDDETSVLHWQISLSIPSAHGDKNVILNLVPGGADLRTGILLISSQKNDEITKSPGLFNVTRAANWTVKDVIDAITEAGYHHFKYDDGGSGCRHWCTSVIRLFEKMGGVVEGASDCFEDYIIKENAKNPDRFPWPTRFGYFYYVVYRPLKCPLCIWSLTPWHL